MAQVKQLTIKGIRSYGIDEEQTINFRPPLTLIQGKNGSGKTTIIECLKYATGGKPPNSKLFVHDPKCAKKSQINGEVRMKFIDTCGTSLTGRRSSIIKQDKDELQSVSDKNYIEDSTGKSQSFDKKKFNEEMARRLDVSTAILDNVIFCHQEDSNWPFQTPGVLRGKFNKFFDLDKYNTCIDELRKLVKEKRSEREKIEVKLKILKEYKADKCKIEMDLDAKEKELEETCEKIKGLNKCFEEITNKLKMVKEKEDNITRMQNDIKKKENEKNGLKIYAQTYVQVISNKSDELLKLWKEQANKEDELLADIDLSNHEEVLKNYKLFLEKEETNYKNGEAELKLIESERDSFGDEKKKIDEEVQKLHQNAKLFAELQCCKDKKSNTNLEKENLLKKHTNTLKTFLNEVPKEHFKSTVKSHLDNLEEEMDTINVKLNEKQKLLNKHECKKDSLEKKIKEIKTEYEDNAAKLESVCRTANLSDVLDSLCNQIKDLEIEQKRMLSSKPLFEHYINQLQEKACCPLCDTNLTPISEVNRVVDKIRREISNLPNNLEGKKDSLDKLKKMHDVCLTFIPLRDSNIKIEKEIPELQTQVSATKEEIKNIKKEYQDLKSELEKAKIKKRMIEQIMEDMMRLDSCNKDLKQLEDNIIRIQQKISSSGSNCSPEEAKNKQKMVTAKCENAKEKYEKKQLHLKNNLIELSQTRGTYKKITNELEIIKSNQKELKENEMQDAKLTEEIKNLVKSIEFSKSGDLENLEKKLNNEKESKNEQKNELEGTRVYLQKSISELKKKLSERKYMEADEKYYNHFLEAKVLEALCNDFETFSKALDYAMTKFHQDSMYSINAHIRQLWSSVYKGDDVKSIEIKPKETRGNNNVRQYDYNVVMTQNGVERDMRDRCSAGQKMLASVIIRLAIAETLSTDFGMLALDEPTANLDEENSASLGEALSEIVNRRSQKNFQLIIITHDQNFVEQLSRDTNLQEYYVVSRNASHQSVIKICKHNQIHRIEPNRF